VRYEFLMRSSLKLDFFFLFVDFLFGNPHEQVEWKKNGWQLEANYLHMNKILTALVQTMTSRFCSNESQTLFDGWLIGTDQN
jgi:hypothetical protein